MWRSLIRQVTRAIFPHIFSPVRRSVATGGIARGSICTRTFVNLPFGLLIKGLLRDSEGVYGGRHTSIEDHLTDDLRDFLFGYTDVQRTSNVPLDHLRAVAQNYQRCDGTEAAGPQVNGRAIVDLAVNHRVDQPHYVGS